ncbi:hypothetical protein M408DRAFT_208513 [Serendipita vermifera MAFF 305830]|uniref:Uncharacterized protein n=1 Tax=Serendipita vermifera MAFF 305830 TaxID=933852 RepID=A0A0C3B014_SERVB|nr:hypothetical protein M408DRAFT_208513 [Serendipita vermifera MAFF 305830]
MAISLTGLLANGTDAIKHPHAIETVHSSPGISTSADLQSESLVEGSSTSTNSVQPTPPASGSYGCRRYNYNCEICGRPHDRAERARDCANRDKGLTPHVCGGQCGKVDWCVLCFHFLGTRS